MKKGQAAMEFLMTYGWAILVVLVAIGALAYFGVLSPDNFLPERCTGPAGMDCLDKASVDATNNSVTFVLKNNIGFDITNITVVSGTADCSNVQTSLVEVENANGTFVTGSSASNNRRLRVTAYCLGDVQTGKFTSNLDVGYQNSQSGLDHVATVSVTGVANN